MLKSINSIKQYNIFLMLLTLIPISAWFGLHNLYVAVLIQAAFAYNIFLSRKKLWGVQSSNVWLKWYFIWLCICVLRGIFVAGNYMEYKFLMTGTISCMVPVVVYLFDDPKRTSKLLHSWYKASIVLMILFAWKLKFNQSYLAPYLLLFCFFSLIESKKKKYLLLVLSALYITDQLDARSQIIKGSIALLIGLYICFFHKYRPRLMKICHFLGYFSVILLFSYVLTDAVGVMSGKMTATDAEINNDARTVNEKDTRSLLIVDVVESSLKNNYALIGHTPARGFEIRSSSALFYGLYDDESVFNKNERHKNEMVLTNIYTWLGLIGLFLYSMFYFRASYLAVYKSKNKYLPLLGCYMAFRWSYGWIEDVNNFYIQDVSLWIMIAICLSYKFRNMSNQDFVDWINSLVSNKRYLKYENSSIANRP